MKCVSVLAVLLASISLVAQETPRAEIFGGYSYVNIDTNGLTSRQSANGWEASVTGYFTRYFGVEFSGAGYYKTYAIPTGLPSPAVVNVPVHDYSYAAGPRVTYGPVFVHALAGADHLSASALGMSASQDGLAAAFGGGFEQRIASRVAARVSVDYALSRHNILGGSSVTQNNVRVSAGLVYRFGHVGETVASGTAPSTRRAVSGSVPVPALGLMSATSDDGPRVTEIAAGSLAEKAGLQVGDVIKSVNGQPVKTALELAAASRM